MYVVALATVMAGLYSRCYYSSKLLSTPCPVRLLLCQYLTVTMTYFHAGRASAIDTAYVGIEAAAPAFVIRY